MCFSQLCIKDAAAICLCLTNLYYLGSFLHMKADFLKLIWSLIEKLCSKRCWQLILANLLIWNWHRVTDLLYRLDQTVCSTHISPTLIIAQGRWFLCQLRFFLLSASRPSFALIFDVVPDLLHCLFQSLPIDLSINSPFWCLMQSFSFISIFYCPRCLLSTSRWFCRITSTIIASQIASDRCARASASLPITAFHCLHQFDHPISYHSLFYLPIFQIPFL